MIFSQTRLHDILSDLPGAYKELFIEHHAGASIRVMNGRVEPVVVSEGSGANLLLTQGSERYFRTMESAQGVERLLEQGRTFSAPKWAVSWLPEEGKEYVFPDVDSVSHEAIKLHDVMMPHIERLRSREWIISAVAGVSVSEKSYLAVSNVRPGGVDCQRQMRVFVLAIGKHGEVTQEYFDAISSNGDRSCFTDDRIKALFDDVESKLQDLLVAPPSPSWEMEIVIAAESGGVIIHEAVGHGLEWDAQASSAYSGQIGKQVASPKVTIIDDPTLPWLRGSYLLDHEGTPAERTILIENGVLRNYLHQNASSDHFQLAHNGHARRESYAHEPLVRMGNTYLDNGPDKPEDIIASVKDWLYVTSLWGGQVNTTSGDFVFKINYARRIRDGKIGEVVRPANLAGNGPKMLKEISMVGNDLQIGSNSMFVGGTCGKDGQGMPVTDANPTIKVRLKVTA